MLEVEQLSLDAPDPGGYDESKQWTARFKVKNVKAIDGSDATMDSKSAKTEALKRAQKY